MELPAWLPRVTQEPAGDSLLHVISQRLALLAYMESQPARWVY